MRCLALPYCMALLSGYSSWAYLLAARPHTQDWSDRIQVLNGGMHVSFNPARGNRDLIDRTLRMLTEACN